MLVSVRSRRHATLCVTTNSSSGGSCRSKGQRLLLLLLSCVAGALACVQVARVFAHVPPAASCSTMV
jgi:hypothetical protein